MTGFCSNVSLQGMEPLSGSAIPANDYVFITWPKIFWGSSLSDAVHFPKGLLATIGALQRKFGVATRLVDNGDRNTEVCNIIVGSKNVIFDSVPTPEVAELLEDIFEGANQLDTARQLATPQVFCCTHGQRDRCCAKFGYGLYKSLLAEAERSNSKVGVWQCSHLGGDRFTATTITFPGGQMHGRLRASNAYDLLRCTELGVPYSSYYRGSVFLRGHVQLAEAVVNELAAVHNSEWSASVHEAKFLNPEKTSAVLKVNVDTDPNRSFVVQCKRKQYEVTIDCRSLDREQTKTVTRWVATQILEIDPGAV